MRARLAAGLKQLPDAVGRIRLPHVFKQFAYWASNPPEHELLALFARCYTTWKPDAARAPGEIEQRRSLEQRWKAGAMNVRDIFLASGGQPISL